MQLLHKGGKKWVAMNDAGQAVHEFDGKRDEVEPAFEAWLAEQEVQDEEAPASKPNLPDPTNLKGLARTAALNAQVDTTFVEAEWKQRSGVVNESNAVYNVPEGWQVCWATPRKIDGGRHANYLRSRGYRPVEREEMASDMYEDGLYVAFVDESDSQYVFMQGSQLFIGPSERLAKLRQQEYDAHMAAFNRKSDSIEEDAERQGAFMRTNRDVSPYNPMRR